MARLVSVNVGRPARIGVRRGRPLMSAIGKLPVDGRVRVAGVNVAGDRQADLRVHGGPDKAVYATRARTLRGGPRSSAAPSGQVRSART